MDRLNVRCVINCSASEYVERESVEYIKLQGLEDDNEADISLCFEGIVRYIKQKIDSGIGVLVHCHAGKSRSATICAAYLVAKEGLSDQ